MKNFLLKALSFIGESLFLIIVGMVISTFIFFAYIFWGGITVMIILSLILIIDILFFSVNKLKDLIFYLLGMSMLAVSMYLPVAKPFLVDVLIFYLGTLIYIYPFTVDVAQKRNRPS